MAEEQQKWQEAVTNHVLCANNCGFFGSSTTLNLCSKCYKDHCLKERNISTAKIAVEQSLTSDHAPSRNRSESESSSCAEIDIVSSHAPPRDQSESSSSVEQSILTVHAPPRCLSESENSSVVADLVVSNGDVTPLIKKRNRCGSCNKRVGLTGFTCRCGMMFCGTHRYPEKHDCSFDFKTMGKEAIARDNPVVKAAKLDKI